MSSFWGSPYSLSQAGDLTKGFKLVEQGIRDFDISIARDRHAVLSEKEVRVYDAATGGVLNTVSLSEGATWVRVWSPGLLSTDVVVAGVTATGITLMKTNLQTKTANWLKLAEIPDSQANLKADEGSDDWNYAEDAVDKAFFSNGKTLYRIGLGNPQEIVSDEEGVKWALEPKSGALSYFDSLYPAVKTAKSSDGYKSWASKPVTVKPEDLRYDEQGVLQGLVGDEVGNFQIFELDAFPAGLMRRFEYEMPLIARLQILDLVEKTVLVKAGDEVRRDEVK